MSTATTVAPTPEPPAAPVAPSVLLASRAWREQVRALSCVAVVVHYRNAAQTVACVESLREHAADVGVLVVDNDGNPEAHPALRHLAEPSTEDTRPVAVLVAGRNGGFGAGCNAGVETALSANPSLRHVLLLNPDARLTPGAVERLRATARAHPDAGIVGGRILSEDGATVQFENGRLRPWTLSRLHCAAPSADQPFETTFVTGALMLVDAALLRDGLRFDEGYFLYVEDLDLCCEVRARGRSLWIDPAAVVHHRGGGAWEGNPAVLGSLTAGQVYWMARSKMRFARKRLPWLQRSVHWLFALFAKPAVGLLTSRSGAFLGPYYRGVRDGARDR